MIRCSTGTSNQNASEEREQDNCITVVNNSHLNSLSPTFGAVLGLWYGKLGATLVAELGQWHAVLVKVYTSMASHARATAHPAHAIGGVVAAEGRDTADLSRGEGVRRKGRGVTARWVRVGVVVEVGRWVGGRVRGEMPGKMGEKLK